MAQWVSRHEKRWPGACHHGLSRDGVRAMPPLSAHGASLLHPWSLSMVPGLQTSFQTLEAGLRQAGSTCVCIRVRPQAWSRWHRMQPWYLGTLAFSDKSHPSLSPSLLHEASQGDGRGTSFSPSGFLISPPINSYPRAVTLNLCVLTPLQIE